METERAAACCQSQREEGTQANDGRTDGLISEPTGSRHDRPKQSAPSSPPSNTQRLSSLAGGGHVLLNIVMFCTFVALFAFVSRETLFCLPSRILKDEVGFFGILRYYSFEESESKVSEARFEELQRYCRCLEAPKCAA